jgi:hypothetical protein
MAIFIEVRCKKMDKILLTELIDDMTDIIEHTAGETKEIARNVRCHLIIELKELNLDNKNRGWKK